MKLHHPSNGVTKVLRGDYPSISFFFPCIKLLLRSLNDSQTVFLELANDESNVKLDHVELNYLAR